MFTRISTLNKIYDKGGEDCPSVPTNVLFFSLEGANFELKILAE